jgi:tetratricopeptide (TPR) repeat protein
MGQLERLIEGVRSRSLWQVAGLYAAGAWITLQVVDVLSDAFDLPGRFAAIALTLLIIGFPVVLATAFLQHRMRRSDGFDEDGAAPVDTGDVTPARSARHFFTWRNVIMGGVTAVAVWGVVVTAWLVTQERGPPGREAGSDPAISRAVILLGTKLDGAGELRSVDSRALLSFVVQEGLSVADPAHASAVAARFGAGLFVLGDVVEAGGRLQVTAALYGTDEATRPLEEASAEGEDPFNLVDEVATQLLAGVEGGPGARVRGIAAVTTPSLDAFRAYLEGEAEFRRGSFEPAFDAFRRATELDSLFAMAYYRLSVAAEWLTRADAAQAAAEKAYRNASRLSERDRRLLEAFLAWRRGAQGEAEGRYRAIVGTYPTDVEAWFQLGEIQHHSNPIRGRSFAESRAAFEQVLEFEPNDATSIIHLVRIAASEGRLADLDSLAARFFALNPDADREHEVRAIQLMTHADSARIEAFLAEAAPRADLILIQLAWNSVNFSHNPSGAERAARLLTDRSRFTPEVWTTGHTLAAYTLLARGRVADAYGEIDVVDQYDPYVATELRALFSLIPLMPADRATLERRRVEIEGLDPSGVAPSGNSSFFFSVLDDRHEIVRFYLAGVLAARLGHVSAAMDYASRLETATPPENGGTLTFDLASGVRAQIALAEDRTEDALAAMESIRQDIFYQMTMSSPYDAGILERFARGLLLHEVGRNEEAIGWLAHLGEVNPVGQAFRPAALLRLGEIRGAGGGTKTGARFGAVTRSTRIRGPFRGSASPSQSLPRSSA